MAGEGRHDDDDDDGAGSARAAVRDDRDGGCDASSDAMDGPVTAHAAVIVVPGVVGSRMASPPPWPPPGQSSSAGPRPSGVVAAAVVVVVDAITVHFRTTSRGIFFHTPTVCGVIKNGIPSRFRSVLDPFSGSFPLPEFIIFAHFEIFVELFSLHTFPAKTHGQTSQAHSSTPPAVSRNF
jgi:hypothetical protein